MIDHAEPAVDRVAAPSPLRRGGVNAVRLTLSRSFGWALNEAVLFPIVALFVVGLLGNIPGELLSDSWLVVLGGREVVQNGLPHHDTLAIWTQGREWVDQQWLGQLAFYGLYALGGIKLALIGHVTAAGTAFVLALIAARWRGGSTRAVCWLALPSIFLLVWGSWNARAQSLALVLFVAVVWLLIADARAQSRRVFLALPLLVVWANVHGTVLTGALLVVLWGITYAVERRKSPSRTWAPRAAVLCLAPIACLFASPYAADLPGYYHLMLTNSGLRQYIVEWRPTAPSLQTAPFFGIAFLAVWLAGRCRERLLRYEKIVLALTLLMALQSIRSVIWFTLVALMLVPVALDGVLKPNVSAMRFQLLNRALVAASLAGVVVASTVIAAKPTSWVMREYPNGVLTAVDRVQARDPNVRVFANEMYTDWLLLERPSLKGKLAFDIRFELTSKAEIQRLVDIRRRVEGWRQAVSSYGLFVLNKGPEGPLAKALLREPGAKLEYRGHDALVIWRPAKNPK
jgi:hypothetical protein